MRKTFEMDYGNGKELEEFDIDYIVLFGAYDNEHPESNYNNRKSKTQVYDTIEEAIIYIKHDLKLVAGGGYNTDHIHNVKFEIEKC